MSFSCYEERIIHGSRASLLPINKISFHHGNCRSRYFYLYEECKCSNIGNFINWLKLMETLKYLKISSLYCLEFRMLENLSQLKHLSLRNCSIFNANLENCLTHLPIGLEILQLDNIWFINKQKYKSNKFKLDFHSLCNLKWLKLNNIRIKNIAWNSLQSFIPASLIVLELSLEAYNVDLFQFLSCLKSENLRKMSIMTKSNFPNLKPNLFAGIKKVVNLQLSCVKMKKINGEQFSSLHCLESLDLSHNEISTVNYEDVKDLKKLKRLNLSSNPISYFEPRCLAHLKCQLEELYYD